MPTSKPKGMPSSYELKPVPKNQLDYSIMIYDKNCFTIIIKNLAKECLKELIREGTFLPTSRLARFSTPIKLSIRRQRDLAMPTQL